MEPITETTNSEEGVSTKTLLPYDESLAAFFKDLGISDFEQPFFIAVDGVRYTFESAKFEDGQILINTRFEKKGSSSVTKLYGINDLRRMIGKLPTKNNRWVFLTTLMELLTLKRTMF